MTYWGELVGIRPLRPGDAGVMRRFAMNPEVADLLFEEKGGPVPSTFALAGMIFSQWIANKPEFAIVARTGQVIGVVRLWRVSEANRSAMLTIFIGDQRFWGKGFGTEALRLVLKHAFGPMGLHRVELHVFDFNTRAIRCYEKVGFAHEGARRQALVRHGRYHDILVMGVLDREFFMREAERNSTAR